MIQVRKKAQSGFTIVELSLSMVFISTLLLAIALLTLQISTVYNKGLTTKAVNEAGQLVSSDMQRTLNVSKPLAIKMAQDTPTTGGRLCADTTVYAWNYGKNLTNGFNKFAVEGGAAPASVQKAMRLVRFPSNGRDYCAVAGGGYPNVPSNATDILAEGDARLAVHKFVLGKASATEYGYPVQGDASGLQRMYPIEIVIGTSEQSVLDSNVDGCKVPVTITDDQYCAVNQFNFTARAGNR